MFSVDMITIYCQAFEKTVKFFILTMYQSLSILDSLIHSFDKSNSNSLIDTIIDSNQHTWQNITANSTPKSMQQESLRNYELNKKSSNVYKRTKFIQNLFKQYQTKQHNAINHSNDDEKIESKTHDYKTSENEFFEPLDHAIFMNEGVCKKINNGCYCIASCAGLSVRSGFSLLSKLCGKWYYEIQLLCNPNKFDLFNIGFAN
eukprot:183500_1